MPESGPFGSVRGVCSNAHPYRDMRDRALFEAMLSVPSLVVTPNAADGQPSWSRWMGAATFADLPNFR